MHLAFQRLPEVLDCEYHLFRPALPWSNLMVYGIQSALKDRGIDKMLAEAREDHKENDDLNMRRKCM
jgi:hypothetical protein